MISLLLKQLINILNYLLISCFKYEKMLLLSAAFDISAVFAVTNWSMIDC